MLEIKKFIPNRIKETQTNIVTKMWNIQSQLDNVIAMGRGDTDLDTPRHIIDAGIHALNNGATHYTHPMGLIELREAIAIDIANNGEIYEFVFNNYVQKIADNGVILLEGGSETRDNIEWMIKYNKPKIQPVLEKYKHKYNIKVIGTFPSITIISL